MALLNLSTAKIGDVFPPTSYMIRPENVKRYAEVNEVSQPTSLSFSYVPPGMLAHDLVWIASRYFDITGVLLTGLELKFEKPVADSGMITVRDARIQDIFFQDGDQYTVASFNVVNDRDDVLCRSKITCVSKSAKGHAR